MLQQPPPDTMSHTTSEERKARERDHGRFLAPDAERIWGWGTPAGKLRAHRRAQLIIQRAEISEGKRVIEFGCGTGLFTRAFAETGALVMALDLSPDLVAEAAQKPMKNIIYMVGDVERPDFPDVSFDAVVGSSILHHVNAELSLGAAYRILKSGGRVAFAEPNMLNPQIAVQKNIPYFKRMMGDSPDETAFFRWEAEKILQNTGFVEVGTQPFDFLHPYVPAGFIPLVKALEKVAEAIPLVREISGSILLWGRKP